MSHDTSSLKQRLYTHCLKYVTHHIDINQHMVNDAQHAANEETKSTAGDRYETGRAMKQRETELYGKRIQEALQQRAVLMSIDPSRTCVIVEPGALVDTSVGLFFVAIHSDEIAVDGEEYCPISPDSPIGTAMMNKKAGDTFEFRGKQLFIQSVW